MLNVDRRNILETVVLAGLSASRKWYQCLGPRAQEWAFQEAMVHSGEEQVVSSMLQKSSSWHFTSSGKGPMPQFPGAHSPPTFPSLQALPSVL